MGKDAGRLPGMRSHPGRLTEKVWVTIEEKKNHDPN